MSYAGVQHGNGFGTYANRPAQGQAGRKYYATDTGVMFYDNGTAWQPIKPAVAPMTAMDTATFAWQNQNSSTATQQGSGIALYSPSAGGGSSQRMYYIATPGTPYTVTAKLCNLSGNPVITYGLAWTDGTKYHTFHVNNNVNAFTINWTRWSNASTGAGDDYSSNVDSTDFMSWMRVADNGTNRSIAISRDGINFITLASVARTTYLTPTRVGVLMNPFNQDVNLILQSWNVT